MNIFLLVEVKIPLTALNRRAFTFPELLVVLFLIVVLVGLFWPAHGQRRQGPWIQCTNNLKNIGRAFCNFASDNEQNFPMQVAVTNGGTIEILLTAKASDHFRVLSNELTTPKVLLCPTDTRFEAGNFATLADANLSYFLNLDAHPAMVALLLAGDLNLVFNQIGAPEGACHMTRANDLVTWAEPTLHKGSGQAALADGSVQNLTSSRLRAVLREGGGVTNRLVFP